MVCAQFLFEQRPSQTPSASRSHRLGGRLRRGIRATVTAVFCVIALAAKSHAAEVKPRDWHDSSSASPLGSAIELQGRVVCLAEEMNHLHQTVLPSNHEHLYGFKTAEGKYYTLLRTKFSEALFVDRRLQLKDLMITGHVFPNSQIMEVIRLRSLRHGQVFDVLYYCDICAIDMVEPGICLCCQQPVELIERPATKKTPAEAEPSKPAP